MFSKCVHGAVSASAVSASATALEKAMLKGAGLQKRPLQLLSAVLLRPASVLSSSSSCGLFFSSSALHTSSSSLSPAIGVRRWQANSGISSLSSCHPKSLHRSHMKTLLSLLSDESLQRFFSSASPSPSSSSTSSTSTPSSSNSAPSSDSSTSTSASGSESSDKTSDDKRYEQAAAEEAEYQASHQSEMPRSFGESFLRFIGFCFVLAAAGYGGYQLFIYLLPTIIGWHAHAPQNHWFPVLYLMMMATTQDKHRLRMLENDECLNALLTMLDYHAPAPGPEGILYSDMAALVFFKFASEPNTRDLLIQKVDLLLSYLFAAAYSNGRLGPPHALLGIKFLLASKDPKILKEFEEKKGFLLLARLGKRPNDPTANPAMECILTLFDYHLVTDLKPLFQAYPMDREAIVFAAANIGTLYLERKQHEQALYALAEALKLNEKNSAIRTHYGAAMWAVADRKNDTKLKEEAIRQFRLSLKNDPGTLDAAYHLSYALLAQVGVKFSSERTEFAQEKTTHSKEEEKQIDATFKEVIQVLQQSLNVAKEIAKEYEIHEKAKQGPGGISLSPMPLGIHPMQLPAIPLICYLLVRSYQRYGRYDDAIKVAKDWAIHFHHQPIPHFMLGRLALESGDIDLALRELRKAYDLDPERPEITYKLALALYKANRLEQAERKAVEALQNDRRQRERISAALPLPNPHESVSVMKEKDNEWKAKSSQLRPLKLPRLLLARIYIRQSKFAEALDQLNRYLKNLPQGVHQDILAEFLRAICIQQIDGLEKACSYFGDAMQGVHEKVDKKNGGSGLNKYLKDNKKIAKKLQTIEEACKKATQKDKEENSPFGSMCKKYEELKLLR